jgi:hypothetical protein
MLNQIVVLLLSFCTVLVIFKVKKVIYDSVLASFKKVQLAKAQTHFLKAPMPIDHHRTQTISKPPNVSRQKLQSIKSNQLCLAKYHTLYNPPLFAHARPLSAINPNTFNHVQTDTTSPKSPTASCFNDQTSS